MYGCAPFSSWAQWDNSPVKVDQKRRTESSFYPQTNTEFFVPMPRLLGGHEQQMVSSGLHCSRKRQQGGMRALLGPGLGDGTDNAFISVTENLFLVIKASPSGSTWQQRAAGGHRRKTLLMNNGRATHVPNMTVCAKKPQDYVFSIFLSFKPMSDF